MSWRCGTGREARPTLERAGEEDGGTGREARPTLERAGEEDGGTGREARLTLERAGEEDGGTGREARLTLALGTAHVGADPAAIQQPVGTLLRPFRDRISRWP